MFFILQRIVANSSNDSQFQWGFPQAQNLKTLLIQKASAYLNLQFSFFLYKQAIFLLKKQAKQQKG